MDFATALAEAIGDRGFPSLRAFATSAGLSRESIRLYTTGARVPSNKAFDILIRALGLRGTKQGETLANLLLTARMGKPPGKTKAYGPRANREIAYQQVSARTQQATEDSLVEVFFAHAGRERTPELELIVRNDIRKALKGLE